jgi:lipopolysaccharide transport system ATP-binding protein
VIAIRFEDVWKRYPFYDHTRAGLKAFLLRFPQTIRGLRRERFTALRGVSFEVKQGETVGLIGPNGSGKSTTLGVVAGVLAPDAGEVAVFGRVCPLLELGAGFHPDLTGRDNIVLNGVLSGLTRRAIFMKMESIIDFSELAAFIDQPIRTYSSGMTARLGFAVAVHLEPEILVIDEVLAVGDHNFQVKCRKKIAEFRQQGVTMMLISHALDEIQLLCDRAIWLDAGSIAAEGPPNFVITQYVNQCVTGPREVMARA